MEYTYLFALSIIVVVCLFGVFSHGFDDNVIQRFSLSLICIGAVSRIFGIYDNRLDSENVQQLFTFGVSLFCVSTSYKLWKKK